MVLPIHAASLPSWLVVNHETKQCAQVFGGDECIDCCPEHPWEIVGDIKDGECPDDYTEGSADYYCVSFQDSFCCIEGHSGAGGDCRNMVVNRRNKTCAFLGDVATDDIPRGWRIKPENMSTYEWLCPYEYS